MRDLAIHLLLGALLAAGAAQATAAGGNAAAPCAADPMRLDLDACLTLAWQTAPALESAAAFSAESQAVEAEARARRLPVLGAAGSYQYASEHMRGELETGIGPPRSLEFGDGHVADFNLGLAVPVYTGGELSGAAAAAGAGREAAARREDSARLDLSRNVRQAFCGALGRQAQAETARLAIDRLRRHLDSVTGALAAGAATGEARLRALARLNQAQQRLMQAEAACDSAGLVLGRLVGRPGAVVRPVGDVTTPFLADADEIGLDPAERPDVAALALEQRKQSDLATAARGRLRPRVQADLRAHYGRPGMNALTNDWMRYMTAGVSVDWPLWDSGARKERANQADARALWLEAQGRDLREAVVVATAGARTSLRSAVEQERQVLERADLQRRLLAMVEGRYAQMSATETEYLDAQDDLTQAELDLALARTRVRLAEAALLWALGR